MISRTLDFIFIDSFAFLINKTLGLVLSTKICNYSWEGKGEDLLEKEQADTEHIHQVLISQDVERGHQN
ncbi:hypothetical protein VF14_12265 [Nostoc linckia z18]|jgi:hypothetical protein|uniref:Uncharacterized protein n=3 Tax=Nostoc TaxID=1177 RepID=A0A9Q5Z8N0_NOSLI|nr:MULTISPECIES: hypothetical protein [Nostoc]MBL1202028.1 hypothetical protein [Nostoc sp. GBBB01]MDZ8012782.1 hypothetical protein [Nostoc sp. ZfuVER08]PHK29048.1 hypothetical protein VF12_31710 [Nostoc linckia z15]PHK46390.1 hypothetical protein VF13_11285 [Nostoc linckia z16]MBD2614599.1 hypothetical protein [Nostoc punctiforme FACHB-252]